MIPKGTQTNNYIFRLKVSFQTCFGPAWATGRVDLNVLWAEEETKRGAKRKTKRETKRETKRQPKKETKRDTKRETKKDTKGETTRKTEKDNKP